jgi:hypothetical protein
MATNSHRGLNLSKSCVGCIFEFLISATLYLQPTTSAVSLDALCGKIPTAGARLGRSTKIPLQVLLLYQSIFLRRITDFSLSSLFLIRTWIPSDQTPPDATCFVRGRHRAQEKGAIAAAAQNMRHQVQSRLDYVFQSNFASCT